MEIRNNYISEEGVVSIEATSFLSGCGRERTVTGNDTFPPGFVSVFVTFADIAVK